MDPSTKFQYRDFCRGANDVPFFHQPWWLDAVCGQEGWGVLKADGPSGKPAAFMPLPVQVKWGLTVMTKPPLTPFLGPWILEKAKEERYLRELAETVPANWYFNQTWRAGYNNWLPFYWAGYRQTTRYTHQLLLPADRNEVIERFRPDVRQKIRKAKKQGIIIRETDEPELLFRLVRKTFEHQNRSAPFRRGLWEKLWAAVHEAGCGMMLLAEGPDGVAHAGLLLLWDHACAYQLIAGTDPARRSSGAYQLLVEEEVRHVPAHCSVLDFCGSMLPAIAIVNKAFGAAPTPYFQLYKGANRWIEAGKLLLTGRC